MEEKQILELAELTSRKMGLLSSGASAIAGVLRTAIAAEKDRCAKVAEAYPKTLIDAGHTIWSAKGVSEAIARKVRET